MLVLYFYILREVLKLEVLNATFQAFVYVAIVTVLRYVPLLEKFLMFLSS